MKKIFCLIDSLGAGGAQRQMVGLAFFLKEKGYDVNVIIYHQFLFYANDLLRHDIPYVYLKKAHRRFTRIISIANYIRKAKPDVVISFLDTPNIIGCCSKLFNRRFKLIVSERNTTQRTGSREKLRFNLFRIADCIVPNAYSQTDYINKTFPFLSFKVHTIPNYVDLNHFSPLYHQRREIQEILVVATIWPPKNTLGFIDAVELLSKAGLGFHVSWYGKDSTKMDYYIACQQRIKEKGIGDYICLLDKTSEIADRYREADFFCLPSFYEGTPNAICEAMASGLPILCSDVCDNSLYVTESVNGFLFNPNDAGDIAKKIKRALLLNHEKYYSFCRESRTMAEHMLSKERFINEYIKLIE